MSPWLYVVVPFVLSAVGAFISAPGLPARRPPGDSKIMWRLACGRWSYVLLTGFDLCLVLVPAGGSLTDVAVGVLCAGICATAAALGFDETRRLRHHRTARG